MKTKAFYQLRASRVFHLINEYFFQRHDQIDIVDFSLRKRLQKLGHLQWQNIISVFQITHEMFLNFVFGAQILDIGRHHRIQLVLVIQIQNFALQNFKQHGVFAVQQTQAFSYACKCFKVKIFAVPYCHFYHFIFELVMNDVKVGPTFENGRDVFALQIGSISAKRLAQFVHQIQ